MLCCDVLLPWIEFIKLCKCSGWIACVYGWDFGTFAPKIRFLQVSHDEYLLKRARPRLSKDSQDEPDECSLKQEVPRSSEIFPGQAHECSLKRARPRSSEFLTVANLRSSLKWDEARLSDLLQDNTSRKPFSSILVSFEPSWQTFNASDF